MISENFVFLGALVSLVLAIPYIKGTVRGEVKPNRATWLMVSIAPMLALAGEFDRDVGLRSLTTFMSGFVPLLIFLASFVNKKSYWKLIRLDYVLAVVSIIGLILWRLTGDGDIAIVFAIFADGAAFTPTLIKAFKYPDTENYFPFLGGIISVIIGLLTLDSWSFANWAFPVYLMSANLIMIYFVKLKPQINKSKKEKSIRRVIS